MFSTLVKVVYLFVKSSVMLLEVGKSRKEIGFQLLTVQTSLTRSNRCLYLSGVCGPQSERKKSSMKRADCFQGPYEFHYR